MSYYAAHSYITQCSPQEYNQTGWGGCGLGMFSRNKTFLGPHIEGNRVGPPTNCKVDAGSNTATCVHNICDSLDDYSYVIMQFCFGIVS